MRLTKEKNNRSYLSEVMLCSAPLATRLEMLSLLLEKGADINQRTKEGTTVLFWCAIRGDVECAKFLVERGADIRITSHRGETVVDRARATLKRNRGNTPEEDLKEFIKWAEKQSK